MSLQLLTERRKNSMKALAQRTGIAALLFAIALLPACSGNEPPETAPAPAPAPERQPTQPAPTNEPPQAGDWETASTASDTLSIEQINQQGILQTIYFDYDQSEIRPDQRAKLQANAQFMRENTDFKVLVAGHCDERGTREYNMALGERRASATMQYLVSLGVPRARIEIISYGEEQPAAQGSTESAWALNRRATFQAISSNDN
jgi:peptidoglycan-associated lipoprotein